MSSQEPTQTENSQKYAVEFMRSLGIQRDNPGFCDVTVVTDGHEFTCHRIVLATASGFFNALLSSGMREDIERRVDLKGISPETFTEILEFVYKAKDILSEKNVFDVWNAANQLQILVLLKDCESFVKEKISNENCFAVYQTSKLLDSQDIVAYSWNYILREFDSVRWSDEILMLTASEMKQLVASQDLVSVSEDRVVEAILRWATYRSEEGTSDCHFKPAIETTGTSNNQNSITEGSDNPGEENISSSLQQHVQQEQLEKSVAKEDGKHVFSRIENLPELMEASRVCLLSGSYLMEVLWTNPMIQASPKTLGIIHQAIRYQLQADRRQDRCPDFAIHRASCKMENVLLAINQGTCCDTLACRKQDGKWCYVGKRSAGPFVPYSASCYDDNIYIATDSGTIIVYMTSIKQWSNLPNLSTASSPLAMIPLGNFLYAVYKDGDRHSIEMINVRDTLDAKIQGQWRKVGTLSTTGINICCTTSVGDKIILFGSESGKEDTIVECFDTNSQSSSRLNEMPKPSAGMISFRKDNEAFVLQKSGALWRIRTCPDPPFIEVKHETLLWDFYRDLQGAALFKDELLLFGPSISSSVADEQWELGVPDLFKRVRNITCNENYSCFMHAVIPKGS